LKGMNELTQVPRKSSVSPITGRMLPSNPVTSTISSKRHC
jgi:hypothetical protein